MSDLTRIVSQFQVDMNIAEIVEWGGGHINATYRVKNASSTSKDVLLQKINTQVFSDVDALMHNYALVTNHIKQKVHYQELAAGLISEKSGDLFVENEAGVWRMTEFIPEKFALETPRSAQDCILAGEAYGSFLHALVDIPLNKLAITIPGFHDIRGRLNQFDMALEDGIPGRIEEADKDILQIQAFRSSIISYYDDSTAADIPRRITHNDTKLNNVLIMEGKLGTVIDLDTVMPGYTFYDVGDALRTMAVVGKEDEADLSRVKFVEQYKTAFIEGYLSQTEHILTSAEIASLDHSGAYMAFIMAVRFLTDYLIGDLYYKTNYSHHNLVRAKNQLNAYKLLST